MDLQADLNWILKELKQVKDPTFLEAIKNMLKYRKELNSNLTEEQVSEGILMNEAEQDIKKGRTCTIDESHKIIDNWKL